MYGWRAKIGVLVPCVNTTTEPEFNTLALNIPGVSIHSARMHLGFEGELTKQALMRMHEEAIEETIPEIMHANVDLIVFACTSGSFAGGKGWDASTIEKISQETGIQATTTSSALLAALEYYEVEKVALGTPYDEKVTQLGKSFLKDVGYEVVKSIALDSMDVVVKGVGPKFVYDLGREVDSPKADCVFISCTQVPTLEVVNDLERDLGKPVLTANLVSFWHACNLLSIRVPKPEYGMLFT